MTDVAGSNGSEVARAGRPRGPAVATAYADHVEAWSEVVAQNFVPLAIEPGRSGDTFDGSLAATNYGDVHVGKVAATSHVVWRDKRHLDQGGTTDVKLSLVLSGRLCVEQGDAREVVEPGCAAMYNCGDEYRLIMDEPFSLLVLQTDRIELEQRVASDLTGAVMFGRSNLFARALWSVARELCPDLPTDGVRRQRSDDTDRYRDPCTASSPVLGDKMIDLLALAIAEQTGGRLAAGPGRREMRMRAVSHIVRHLADDRLSPRTVASAIGVSQRMLHSLFQESGDSVMEFMIRERLQRAHAELVDHRRHGHRTITDIAMSWGFKSSSHFSRRFSEHYGMTPSETRVAAAPPR